MQIRAMGMDVDVADPVTGESIAHTGEAGEMIVRKPFPSMPCFFWGDGGGKIYKSSYFERFSNIDVWAQHDWLSWNPKTGGYVMHGRSDGVLSETHPFTTIKSVILTSGRPFRHSLRQLRNLRHRRSSTLYRPPQQHPLRRSAPATGQ